jgi:hypothetical protein
MLGHRQSLGTAMLGHKMPLGKYMLGHRAPLQMLPKLAAATKSLAENKKMKGLEKMARKQISVGTGWAMGGY